MKIKCLKCGEIIESLSIHDFKKCKCGSCFIDGGNKYTRIGGNPKDIVLINDDGIEEKLKFSEDKKDKTRSPE